MTEAATSRYTVVLAGDVRGNNRNTVNPDPEEIDSVVRSHLCFLFV